MTANKKNERDDAAADASVENAGDIIDKGKIKVEEKPLSIMQKTFNTIVKNLNSIQNGVENRDRIVLSAVSKHDRELRSNLSEDVLAATIDAICASDASTKDELLGYVQQIEVDAMQVSASEGDADEPLVIPENCLNSSDIYPEMTAYTHYLVFLYVHDHGTREQSSKCINSLMNTLNEYNRRTMDPFSAKVYYFYALTHEPTEIRSHLLQLFRTSCLRHDEPGQGTLINLILKNYLDSNLYSQAHQFLMNTVFPEHNTTNYQFARYLYYKGRINCIQLNYSDALDNLTQAIRRAPQNSATGFRQHSTKLLILVQLLLGVIPMKEEFRARGLERSLRPYYQITQSVRTGDLSAFNKTLEQYKTRFANDNTFNIIARLRRNVIKAGLRKISLSYSKISIAEITERLCLDSVADAEYVISKAIHDGVMDAVIDREHGYVFSKENNDIYATSEPRDAFDRRIKFCLDIHNEAVKGLRFPEVKKEDSSKKSAPMIDIENLMDIEIEDDEDDMME